VPNWIVGLFERTFAFGIVLANVEGAYAVLGWRLNWHSTGSVHLTIRKTQKKSGRYACMASLP
jgi:hypothetical protein